MHASPPILTVGSPGISESSSNSATMMDLEDETPMRQG